MKINVENLTETVKNARKEGYPGPIFIIINGEYIEIEINEGEKDA